MTIDEHAGAHGTPIDGGGASSNTYGNDVEMQHMTGIKRPVKPGGHDIMVCGLEVRSELTQTSTSTLPMMNSPTK